MRWANVFKETEEKFDDIHKRMVIKRHREELYGKIIGYLITYLLVGIAYSLILIFFIKTSEATLSILDFFFIAAGFLVFFAWSAFLRTDNWEPVDGIYVAKTILMFVICISFSVIATIASP